MNRHWPDRDPAPDRPRPPDRYTRAVLIVRGRAVHIGWWRHSQGRPATWTPWRRR